jgi:hypothetical protein
VAAKFTAQLWLSRAIPFVAGLVGAILGNPLGAYFHFVAALDDYSAKPHGDYDIPAHGEAVRDSNLYGAPHGQMFGAIVAFLVALALVRYGRRWSGLAAGIVAGTVAAVVVGYLRI